MMDSDQEVVREPFDDQNDYEHDQEVARFETNDLGDSNVTPASLKFRLSRESDQTDVTYHDEISDCQESSDEEQEKLARQYNIELKRPKRRKSESSQRAYERLMNSPQISSEPSSNIAEDGQEKQNAQKQTILRTSVTADCIYHKGTFYQKGDIVAICDQEDGQMYFAQLTGFLQDKYCEKSASLNWLVPIRRTTRDFFDPSAYQIGLEDVQLRKLECMTFVRHCPHDYYYRKLFQTDSLEQQNISVKSSRTNKGHSFIWTTMKPCPVPKIEKKILE